MSDRRGVLTEAFKSGNFLEALYACSRADRNEREDLALELAALHNEGLIDVIAGFKDLRNSSSSGPDFFLTRHIFEKALPHLNAPVSPVMSCVLQLFRDAGQDIVAGAIIEGFVGFCAKEPSRPREALKEIEADPEAFADMLTAALSAGSRIDNPKYLAEAIRLSESGNIELRRRAVYAVGKLSWPDGAIVTDSAFEALERSTATETDDQIFGGIVKSAFALLQRDKTQEGRAASLIAIALTKGDDCALHAASEIFGLCTSELPAALCDAVLPQLMRVKPTNKGTLDLIDYGISHLIKTNSTEPAIQFLEDFLLAHPEALTLNTFDSAASEIHGSPPLLNKVLTRWFLRGEHVLCDGINGIASAHHGNNIVFDIDPGELRPLDIEHILFVAHKALGYLFFQPVSAASVLISLMRHAHDDETRNELASLLFDPLLLNFPGSAREYVVRQSALESGKVKETIDTVLNRIRDYLDVLGSVGTLPALHPGEAQREVQHRNFSREMAESWKSAEAQSVILNLIPKTVLLYGRKSIDYVYGRGGQSQRMETNLKSHGTSIEFARMERIDPYGMYDALRFFKTRRLRA